MYPTCIRYKNRAFNFPAMTTTAPIRELCTGRLPQGVTICRARIDPYACLDLKNDDRRAAVGALDSLFCCPPCVPVFTTEKGLESMSPGGGRNGFGKRARNGGDDGLIPVIANISVGISEGNDLIFVGISYNRLNQFCPACACDTLTDPS